MFFVSALLPLPLPTFLPGFEKLRNLSRTKVGVHTLIPPVATLLMLASWLWPARFALFLLPHVCLTCVPKKLLSSSQAVASLGRNKLWCRLCFKCLVLQFSI